MSTEKKVFFPIKFRKDVQLYKSDELGGYFDLINQEDSEDVYYIKTSNDKAPKKFSDIFDVETTEI
jgi:hypothetical protein